MITSIALTLALAPVVLEDKPMVCAIMGGPVRDSAPVVEFAGISFGFCCAGCDVTFAKDPAAQLKKAEKSEGAIGASLFDPVSHKRIKADKAKASVDFKGIRYYFESADNLKAFNTDTKKYTTAPKKESLTCPVMGEEIATYSKATSYVDYDGVRYYICCEGCVPAFEKDPAKYAGKAVAESKVIPQKKG